MTASLALVTNAFGVKVENEILSLSLANLVDNL
jgi:hypothetical protein